jgi:hypothetical protein
VLALVAAVAARSVALAGFGLGSLIEILASLVVWQLQQMQAHPTGAAGAADDSGVAFLAARQVHRRAVRLRAGRGGAPEPLPAGDRLARADRGGERIWLVAQSARSEERMLAHS